ncbi:MAG: hypothetical protein NC548_38935 [Lachnospiraceae bacterium]|nr:hypothetical protein [Lachnospiraceae bacterium]
MSRRKKQNDVSAMFKKNFNVSLVHKPTMEPGDTFYYLVLDDCIRVRFKLFGTVIVIDEITSLTMKYMPSVFSTLMDTLVTQDKYTVLISILGNTSELGVECIKSNAAIVEDARFITVPANYYNRMKDYYKGDETKFGFYLLAVKEEDELCTPEEPPKKEVVNIDDLDLPEEVDMGPSIKIGVKPILIRFTDLIKSCFPDLDTSGNDILQNIIVEVAGIKFRAQTNPSDTELHLSDFELAPDYRYTDLMKLFTHFITFLDDCPDIYVRANLSAVKQVCEFLLFTPQRTNLGSLAQWDLLGIFKITKSAV